MPDDHIELTDEQRKRIGAFIDSLPTTPPDQNVMCGFDELAEVFGKESAEEAYESAGLNRGETITAGQVMKWFDANKD